MNVGHPGLCLFFIIVTLEARIICKKELNRTCIFCALQLRELFSDCR